MRWFVGYVACLFLLSLASVWFTGLLPPHGALDMAARLATYALIWLGGATAGVLMIDSAHSRPRR